MISIGQKCNKPKFVEYFFVFSVKFHIAFQRSCNQSAKFETQIILVFSLLLQKSLILRQEHTRTNCLWKQYCYFAFIFIQ